MYYPVNIINLLAYVYVTDLIILVFFLCMVHLVLLHFPCDVVLWLFDVARVNTSCIKDLTLSAMYVFM